MSFESIFLNRHSALPRLGFGTAALGDQQGNYSGPTSGDNDIATVLEILQHLPCLVDTSRNYGDGRSEASIGAAINHLGGVPEGFYLSTKVDRDQYNKVHKKQVYKSFNASLKALRIERVDYLFLHDPEYVSCDSSYLMASECLKELQSIRDAGLCSFIGVASGDVALVRALIEAVDIDAVLVHSRFTILNRQAEALFEECQLRGIRVLNGAPFAGGALVKGIDAKQYVYQEISPAVASQIAKIDSLAEQFCVPLGALALHFSLRSDLVDCTIVGASCEQQVRQIHDWLTLRVSEECWAELDSVVKYSIGDPEAQRWRKA